MCACTTLEVLSLQEVIICAVQQQARPHVHIQAPHTRSYTWRARSRMHAPPLKLFPSRGSSSARSSTTRVSCVEGTAHTSPMDGSATVSSASRRMLHTLALPLPTALLTSDQPCASCARAEHRQRGCVWMWGGKGGSSGRVLVRSRCEGACCVLPLPPALLTSDQPCASCARGRARAIGVCGEGGEGGSTQVLKALQVQKEDLGSAAACAAH